MTKTMPADAYATLAAVVEQYPHTGTDDARREAMQKVVQTLRARHDPRYVWKTEHQSLIAPSKDGLGYVAEGEIVHGRLTTMFIWDTISGSTRKPNAPPLVSEEARQAYVLAPEPKDWLSGSVPAPPPPPSPVDLSPVVEALLALAAQVEAMGTELKALRADLNAASARPWPEYTTRILMQTVTLTPKK